MVLATKSGAFGIDLTAANHVVLFDSWWNPQLDQQAVARAYRKNQTRPTFVYRLVAAGTVEERCVLRTQTRKLALFAYAVDGCATQAVAGGGAALEAVAAVDLPPVLAELSAAALRPSAAADELFFAAGGTFARAPGGHASPETAIVVGDSDSDNDGGSGVTDDEAWPLHAAYTPGMPDAALLPVVRCVVGHSKLTRTVDTALYES
jgi:hypothetical protein